jgi:hypothetical protein
MAVMVGELGAERRFCGLPPDSRPRSQVCSVSPIVAVDGAEECRGHVAGGESGGGDIGG